MARFLRTATVLATLVPAIAAIGPWPASVRAAHVDLPAGGPPALYRPEPTLPVPAGWPFGDAFPRTSGTGRLTNGAFFWSDFLYDDHGAGGYTYAPGPAKNNGADVFRTAIGLDANASYWRVDWNTLVDPAVPIAAFAIDTAPTAGATPVAWPGVPGLRSPGVDKVVVVSSRGAWLHAPGAPRVALPVPRVDKAARSFVVRIPRAVLAPSGTWRVWLVAGLADATGEGFAPVPLERGGRPNQPPVYNASFRTEEEEPARGWSDATQAAALSSGDISALAADVPWGELAARRTTSEFLPKGRHSIRWFVSSLEPDQGVMTGGSGFGTTDGRADYLGRVQPYSIYVPSTYRPSRPAGLVLMQHSFSSVHTQYNAKPKLFQQACDARHAICVTPLGRGPDGFSEFEAELDFFEVWNRVAAAYELDPDATVLWGVSMGALGTYRMGLTWPELFARAALVIGPPAAGTRPFPGGPDLADPGPNHNTTPLVENARWLPFYIGQGALDELNPTTGELEQLLAFDRLNYRYRYELYPAEDHVVWATKDAYSASIAYLKDARRSHRVPGHITYRWYPAQDVPAWGIGATGAYWVRSPVGRNTAPNLTARIDAVSRARPDPEVVPVRTQGAVIPGDPSPAVAQELTWRLGATPRPAAAVEVDLQNVRAVSLDLAQAGLVRDGRLFVDASTGTAALRVRTDGTTRLVLAGLPAGTRVRSAAGTVTTVDINRRAVIDVPGGQFAFALRPA